MNFSSMRGKTGFSPGTESAIEKVDILRSEGSEGPPRSRSGKDAFLLVDDDIHLIADTKVRHVAGKDIGWRQHVRQRIGAVGERFDIKEDRARNVLCDVARVGIYRWGNTDRRKCYIQDNDAGIVQAGG